MENKLKALQAIEEEKANLESLSDAIWDHPEVKYHEAFAAKSLSDYLLEKGFDVQTGVADIPTAFVASYGTGKPVIGLLAEYDALDNLSQQAEAFERCPVTPGAPGHGCGHNLLGVGVVGAALAIQRYLQQGHPGQIKLFGCPAEEGGSGKTFMARDGVFDGLDAALTWHPGDTNDVANGSNLANCQIQYHFTGKSSHAALSPELGRSALDAAELMNMGVQFLREHMPSSCRIHYAFTNAGGKSPNVVPAEAEVLYLIRAPKLPQVRDLNQRVDDIARGAALMTGTKLTITFVKAVSNVMPNKVLGKQLQTNYEWLGAAAYDDEDRSLALRMQQTMEEKDDYYRVIVSKVPDETLRATLLADADKPLYEKVLPYRAVEETSMASSDVGDVSWICPTAQISAVTMPGGTNMHSWQEVAVGKSQLAKKGMLQASRVLAATAMDLYADPSIIQRAKSEHQLRVENTPYICPIPKGVKPPM